MAKKGEGLAFIVLLAVLVMAPAAVHGASAEMFRQQNGLLPHNPPDWFLKGRFIAREQNPRYIFGPVQDFVAALNGKITWLIEDLELDRLKQATEEGKRLEYSLFLEASSPDQVQYWIFVVLPYENAQAWFDARRAFHGRKASGYYGETQRQLETALRQGIKIKAELRFLIEKGATSLQVPEDVIMNQYKIQPIFDLGTGRRMDAAAKTK